VLYHFHIREQGTLILDEEGSELPNLAAARAEARASVRDLLAEEMKSGDAKPDRSIEITDPSGRLLECIAVSKVLH
jgi:hypothetical protein